MGQKAPDQFDLWPPVARETDPDTSHDSARKVTDSGTRRAQTDEAVLLVRRYPNLTSNELALRGTLSERQLSRRIPDAHSRKLIRPNGRRTCSVTGYPARVWIIDQGGES